MVYVQGDSLLENKSDNSIRQCGDYKITINQASKPDAYPIPRIDDLYATLGGGKTYTKLDMSNAYQQLVLDQPSHQYTTIHTHRGLFQYSRGRKSVYIMVY